MCDSGLASGLRTAEVEEVDETVGVVIEVLENKVLDSIKNSPEYQEMIHSKSKVKRAAKPGTLSQ